MNCPANFLPKVNFSAPEYHFCIVCPCIVGTFGDKIRGADPVVSWWRDCMIPVKEFFVPVDKFIYF